MKLEVIDSPNTVVLASLNDYEYAIIESWNGSKAEKIIGKLITRRHGYFYIIDNDSYKNWYLAADHTVTHDVLVKRVTIESIVVKTI